MHRGGSTVQSPPRILLDTETGVKPLRMSPRRQKVNIGPIAILVLYQPGKRHFLVKKVGPPLLNWNKVSVSWVNGLGRSTSPHSLSHVFCNISNVVDMVGCS